jgi:hypothetical protein
LTFVKHLDLFCDVLSTGSSFALPPPTTPAPFPSQFGVCAERKVEALHRRPTCALDLEANAMDGPAYLVLPEH